MNEKNMNDSVVLTSFDCMLLTARVNALEVSFFDYLAKNTTAAVSVAVNKRFCQSYYEHLQVLLKNVPADWQAEQQRIQEEIKTVLAQLQAL